MIETLSAWLESHQLLAISVAIPVFSALVAAASSWYSTRRALRSVRARIKFDGTLKLAEFRQAWINSLRDEMAEFQSYGVLPHSDPMTERLFYKVGTKIELFMNPSDPDYQVLQASMYRFLQSAEGDILQKYSNNASFVEICQRILKREWDRLKSEIQEASAGN